MRSNVFTALGAFMLESTRLPGFGSLKNHLHGFPVTQFADEDHLRRLPQGRTQCQGKARRVAVKFPLMSGSALVIVQELDRIFDSDDVAILFFVDAVEQRSQRGRFPRPTAPVTITMPSRRLAISPSCGGRPRADNSGIVVGMTRMTTAQLPRWMKILTRKRAIPGSRTKYRKIPARAIW